MGLLDIFDRKDAASLRKEYDHLREKTDRLKIKEKRFEVLHFLDRLEPSIVTMEEQMLPEHELKRLGSYVHAQLKKTQHQLKEIKYEEKARREQVKMRDINPRRQ